MLRLYEAAGLPEIWYLKLVIVLSAAVLMTAGVDRALNPLERWKKNRWLRYLH
jgi:TRAP-type mannitol/chloroaromatic compound transport system permease small subunit